MTEFAFSEKKVGTSSAKRFLSFNVVGKNILFLYLLATILCIFAFGKYALPFLQRYIVCVCERKKFFVFYVFGRDILSFINAAINKTK